MATLGVKGLNKLSDGIILSKSCYSIPQVDGYDQLLFQKRYARFATKFHQSALKFILVHLILNSWRNKVANGIQPLFTYYDP